MSPMFLSEILNKNSSLQYHFATIIIFSVLYHVLSKTKMVGDDEDERFNNYGSSLYYTIVTHFTIGYGDISPRSPLLRFLCCTQIVLAFALTNL